jgi:GNAT superfamily N-acetyltransferase
VNDRDWLADDLVDGAQAVAEELGLDMLHVYARGKDVVLDMLLVPHASRKEGRGSRAVERICKMADAMGRRVVLSPAVRDPRGRGTTSRARLIRFYKRFGFVENRGRHKDFTISESMLRDPKP